MALFYLYRWIRGTFAIQAALGLVFVIIINAAVSALGLSTINFILRGILDVGVLAVIILFQPEIRQLLYRLGQNTNLDRFFVQSNSENTIYGVIYVVRSMSHSKPRALILFAPSFSFLH